MKKYIMLIVLLIFLLFPKNTFAATCDYVELARLNNIASNIEIKLNYLSMDDSISFYITILNLRPGVYIRDIGKNQVYAYDPTETIKTIFDYEPNKNYEFQIYTDLTNCNNKELRNILVKTPSFNSYYKDEVCTGAEGFYLCDRWYANNFSYEEFVSKVKTYKDSLITDKEIVKPTDNAYYDYLLSLVGKTYYYFLGAIIIIGIGSIYYLNKKDDFDLRT